MAFASRSQLTFYPLKYSNIIIINIIISGKIPLYLLTSRCSNCSSSELKLKRILKSDLFSKLGAFCASLVVLKFFWWCFLKVISSKYFLYCFFFLPLFCTRHATAATKPRSSERHVEVVPRALVVIADTSSKDLLIKITLFFPFFSLVSLARSKIFSAHKKTLDVDILQWRSSEHLKQAENDNNSNKQKHYHEKLQKYGYSIRITLSSICLRFHILQFLLYVENCLPVSVAKGHPKN